MLSITLLAMLVGFGGLATAAQAQSLAATGDGHDMWIVLPEADKGLTILHREAGDAPGHFWKVTTLPGLLTPGGTAAGQSQLWLIYNTMMVQAMQLRTDPAMPGARYSKAQFLTSLPSDVTIRSLVGSSTELWALVDVKTPQALRLLENPDTSFGSRDDDDDDVLIIDPNAKKDISSTEPQTTNEADSKTAATSKATDAAAFEKPVARLVRLQRGPWETIALPEDWPTDGRAWLVMTQRDDERPVLVVESQGQEAHRLRVYRHVNNQWTTTNFTTPGDVGEVTFVSLQHQLVMAAKSADQEKMHITLWVLRPERKEIVEIGRVAFDQAASSNWGVAPDGLSATVLMQSGNNPPLAASINLQGQITHPPAPVKIEQPPQFVQNPGQMLLVGVVAVSIFLMFVIWRRDPNLDDVTMPKDRTLADFGRRIGAAAIDLMPCIFIAMLATGVDLSKLQHDWPGRSASWRAMIPGFITIGLFIFHTGLSEMFTGKTLGKAICGIEVISTTGKPPNIWQVLARNALKAFDLIAFYILPVLALVGKHRQRLGDLVGKTLVVMPTEPHPPGELVEDLPKEKNNQKADDDTAADRSSDKSDDSSKNS